jgi:cell division protein FtsW (lipid II flippase)
LFLPRLPVIGEPINGARLWIHVGSLQIQPGELGKIALIVFLAAYLREKREVLAQGSLKDWGPLLVIWGAAMLLLFVTNDLGSALLYYGIFVAMLYVATARLSFVAGALGLFLVGSFLVSQGTPHVRDRVQNWLSPWSTHKIYCPVNGLHELRQNCQSFQEVQSLYSIGHGGMGGTGLGHGIFTGTSGQQVIPDLNTDFIYSALSQELGLIGVAALLLLYMGFVLRGFQVALTASDGFSKLLAAGLSFSFAFQTFVIVGGITRVIPLTGITLPFVSYGGSSVVANFLLVAGLMLISNRANREMAA